VTTFTSVKVCVKESEYTTMMSMQICGQM
jgi:hypothetical protein